MESSSLLEAVQLYYASLCSVGLETANIRIQFSYITRISATKKPRKIITPDHYMPGIGTTVGQFALRDQMKEDYKNKEPSKMKEIGERGSWTPSTISNVELDPVGDAIKQMTGINPRENLSNVMKHLEMMRSNIPSQDEYRLPVITQILELEHLISKL